MVTEYHEGKTLAHQMARYKGDLTGALSAFRPLVDAVTRLHGAGVIHRDIKPQNVFIARDGRLVLGDFGIVIFKGEKGRLTDTHGEKVGTRDWMPEWAHTGKRLEDVVPSFDVFSLGKLLWAMLAGEQLLRLWYFDQPEYDLTRMFPTEPRFQLVNELLSSCVVEKEKDCMGSAKLLSKVDELIRLIVKRDPILTGDTMLPCLVCAVGEYQLLKKGGTTNRVLALYREPNPGFQQGWVYPVEFGVEVFVCNKCGHTQFFSHGDGAWPPPWMR